MAQAHVRAPRYPSGMDIAPPLADKVAFLSDPRSYPGPPLRVRTVETRMSWVFLTDEHAWKLKKPMHVDGVDLTHVEARARHCREEVRLNRRFTDDVYLGAVALRATPSGALSLAHEGRDVDWLVKMRRLPETLMLDRMIGTGAARPPDVRPVAEQLGRFYAASAPEPLTGAAFRARLAARIAEQVRECCRFPRHLPVALVEDVGERQLAFLEAHAGLLDARVDAGRVVEGHGDLRPEHVCLEVPPRIIDCLDFSRELRVVDAAEELGFLALECERLGAPRMRREIFDAYGSVSGDHPDARLVDFYQAVHASLRARLAIRHLDEAVPRHPEKWPALARDYLRLAAQRLRT